MIKNYIKIAFRNITNNKIYSFINIVGLAIGIACCVIIASFIQSELSYDNFHENGDNICRVNLFGKIGDNEFNVANSPTPLAEALREDFPEVVKSVRIERVQDTFIKHNNTIIKEGNFFYADSTIFEVFTIKLTEGNPKSALSSPNNVVITEKIAKKYFGTKHPIGETIIKDDGTEFLITGIVKELPTNSHFHYDFIASMSTIEDQLGTMWVSNDVYTYILLSDGSSAIELENKLPKMVEARVGPQIETLMGVSFNDFNKGGNSIKFFVQPLKDIHLSSGTYANIEPGGSLESIYIFTAIAIVILLLACVNFVNLTTARSIRRSSEVGIRKVLGSYKARLVQQFLSESVLITFISLLVAVGLIEILLPIFNSISGKEIHVSYFTNWEVIPILLCITVFVGILSGSYPAFLLASYKPALVLKSKGANGIKGGKFRGAVVVFQFSITIILLASTLIIHDQLTFVQNKNLGYDNNQMLVLPTVNELGNQKIAFKTEMLKNSNISKATLTSSLPNRRLSATIFQKGNSEDNQNYAFTYCYVDYDFMDTYELELKEGRFFSNEFSTDTASVLINETAVAELGFENPLNEGMKIPDEETGGMIELKIIGVVKDFHMENLREEIRPLVIALNTEREASFLSLKINTENLSQSIALVEEQWNKFLPGKAFEYQFMDDDFNTYYMEEQRTGHLFTSFTILAIFIACLGLLGLISFSVEQRTKEIGIRKVLGASISTILIMLSKEFAKWIIISNVIAIPIVYYFMNQWLENFAYRGNITFSVFIIAGLFSLIIATITVSFHTVKAAIANPVKSLKYE
jgi:putative ABC transport system permease protein